MTTLKPLLPAILVLVTGFAALPAACAVEVITAPAPGPGTLNLAGTVTVAVDAHDDPLVQLAARMFAGDVERVTGKRPAVDAGPGRGRQLIIAGTLGHSRLID